MPSLRRLPLLLPDHRGMTQETRSELRSLAGIAAPLAVAQASQLVMSLAASVLLGRLSGSALAASGLCAVFIQVLVVVSQGVIAGAHPLMAAAKGKSEAEGQGGDGAAYAFGGAVLASLVLSLISVAILLNLPAVLRPFGVSADILRDVDEFIAMAAFAVPAILWILPIRLYFSVSGKSWLTMASVAIGALFYVPALSILTFGGFGFAGHGLIGAGIAYAMAWWLIAAGLTVYSLATGHLPVSTFRNALRNAPQALKDVWKIGWPIALIYAAELGMTLILTLITSGLGTIAIIANQIAYTLNNIAFNPIVAIGQATTVRVAYHLGAGRPVAARLAGNLSLMTAAGLMAFFGVLFFLASEQIIHLLLGADTADLSVIQPLSQKLILILAGFLVFDGIQSAANGALRGLKDTRVPMIVGLCGYWLVGVPTAIVLALWLDLGVVGVWFGILAGIVSVACCLLLRWRYMAGIAVSPTDGAAVTRDGRGVLRKMTSPT
ncbi:MATE family efflux transporter [Neorhizobium alkalisoli]|uniref:MATE family multidrug resistance protein n=1 Tax=Neorhizobium alkalisoli TaxID=528178 RepID=A0A561QPP2_9HYPH|nr:MATE family efflux transporter [Neorhizobium alkalisoli]TWF52320.1 MATE family multidrug resistance protein [Neorhizobium alkalisoli]